MYICVYELYAKTTSSKYLNEILHLKIECTNSFFNKGIS